MAVLEINRHPTAGDLRGFGVLLVVFVALAGGFAYWRLDASTARMVWTAGWALAAIYAAAPPLRRWIYLGWLYAAFPVGWTLSHLALAATYYLVLVPIGLMLRLFRGDPLDRELRRSAASYWAARRPVRDVRRYFRQF